MLNKKRQFKYKTDEITIPVEKQSGNNKNISYSSSGRKIIKAIQSNNTNADINKNNDHLMLGNDLSEEDLYKSSLNYGNINNKTSFSNENNNKKYIKCHYCGQTLFYKYVLVCKLSEDHTFCYKCVNSYYVSFSLFYY